MSTAKSPSELRIALRAQKTLFKQAMFFSLITSVLMLAPTFYMLEVYDRVVTSRSGMTLAMLTLLAVSVYALMGFLEWVRTEILDIGAKNFDDAMSKRIFDSVFEANLRRIPGTSTQIISDLRDVREFLASPAVVAMMEVPMALISLGVIFMINVDMGIMSLAGAFLAMILAYLTERDSQPPLSAANSNAIAAQNYARNSLRNAQVIEAMGMQAGIHRRWKRKQNEFLFMQAQASDAASGYVSLSKLLQLTQSSLLLGLGCWLIIQGSFLGGGGMLIVVSILGGRVVSTLIQVITLWKHVITARDAYSRLDRLLLAIPKKPQNMALPAPTGLVSVEQVMVAAPDTKIAILSGVSFVVPAGQVLAIVGPSASGKSTLARVLVGVLPTLSGKVRLDGVEVFSWNKAELGPHLGYLPQDVELFAGTLAENIARFGHVDQVKVEAAARAVGVHELIQGLPCGYETDIGDDGCFLSGGQRQRIGLARAIYGNPRVLVLDEPNSSLDEAGELALIKTLGALKAQGMTIVLITHRSGVLAIADLMLVLVDGRVTLRGPRDQVLAALREDKPAGAPPTRTSAPTRPALSGPHPRKSKP